MTDWMVGVAVFVAAILAAFLRGRAKGRGDAQADLDEAYRKTKERVKNADVSYGDDDADRQWLRDRSDRPGRG